MSGKYATVLTLLLPFISSCNLHTDTTPHERIAAAQPESVPAPLLSTIPDGTNLLGKKFRLAEDGPEACLFIEDGLLILSLDGEKLVVQKFSTYENDSDGKMQKTDWQLTPADVSAYSMVGSIQAGNNEIVGRINLLVTTIEHRLNPEEMLPLARAISERERSEMRHVAEWKDATGVVRGSATLSPKKNTERMASR